MKAPLSSFFNFCLISFYNIVINEIRFQGSVVIESCVELHSRDILMTQSKNRLLFYLTQVTGVYMLSSIAALHKR